MSARPNENLTPDGPVTAAQPLLSIIIVTYQSRDEIAGCLKSIPEDVCGAPVETIVVDNASTDGTIDFVRSRYPATFTVGTGANLGFGRANNIGYARARGAFILFLNPDTIVNREALEKCLNRLQNEPEIGIISPRLVLANGEMDLACRRSIPSVWDGLMRASGLARLFPHLPLCAGYNLTHLPETGTYRVGAVNGAFMMSSRLVLRRIGLFDEEFFMYGEDLDLCFRCRVQGFSVVYDGRCSIVHFKGRSSSKEYRAMSRELFVGTKKFYFKHFTRPDSRVGRWKYEFLFWLWESYAQLTGNFRRQKTVRPP